MLKTARADQDVRANRLAALRKRHDDIQRKIEGVRTAHKSISDFYLAELKKQKLYLKDMIEELAGSTSSGTVQRA
jgi:hypothetical protein